MGQSSKLYRPISVLIAVIAMFAATSVARAQESEPMQAVSPDGSIVLTVEAGKHLVYSLSIDGETVIDASPIGMTIDGAAPGQRPVVISVDHNSVDEVIMPVVRQKSAQIRDHYNELVIWLEGGFTLTARAYDDGAAWRFSTDTPGDITVQHEVALFKFAGDYDVYFPREESLISHNERDYEVVKLSDLARKDFASLPFLVSTDKAKLLITETDLRDYPGMWIEGGRDTSLHSLYPRAADEWRMTNDRNSVVDTRHEWLAKTQGARSFPWRVIAIAREDQDLIANQLVYLLAEPSRIEDTSWIKPGQIAWDWWNMNNIYGVDFRAGVNTETYKYYIDFASENGIPYIILDEGWYQLGDILAASPDVDVEALIAYGKEKNVKIILWAVWKTLDEKLDEALDQFAKWGAAGIKVDFMQRDDQEMVNYYWRIAEAAAQRKLMVDFHGAHKPAGLRRTWPNVITYEGVKGMEHSKWSKMPTPEHNVTLPFIRMVAGPMDYTPGAMVNAHADEFAIMFARPMSMTTRAHQVALYVVFESPLQMLADNPSNYRREQETVDFITAVPTVWDETRPLAGEVGEYIAVARRSGDDWFVGALTDGEARELTIDLSFLGEGGHQAQIYEDGINADRYASDYKLSARAVTSADKLTVTLAPGGGWAAKISPE